MYVTGNPKTKKALVQLLADGKTPRIFSPGPFPAPTNGRAHVEGPQYPAAHMWGANVLVEDGKIVKVLPN